jgi:protease PrsW
MIDPYVLLVLAVAPGVFWLWYFYQWDRFEPEPKVLVALMFVLGVLVTIPVALVQGFIAILIVSPIIMASVVAPIVEEYAKFFIVRRTMYRNPEFNEPMDGIVYAVAVGLGFASLENILYVFAAYLESPALGVGTLVIRALLSVPGHAIFAGMWGYALGIAKFAAPDRRQGIVIRGLVLAMVLHGLFNFLLGLADYFIYSLLIFLLVLIPVMWWLIHRRINQALGRSKFQ